MLPSLAPKQQSKSLTNRLLKHQRELLEFLFYSEYDIIYLTFEQKHAAYLEKKENKDIRILRLEEMKRHYLAMSEKLHIRVLRFDLDVDKELYRLESLWDALQIPYFHRYYFQSFIYTAYYKNIPTLITNEQKLLRGQNHIYFIIHRALAARQACLRNLKIKLSELSQQDIYEYLHITKQKAHFLERKFQKQRYQIQGYKVKHMSDSDKQPTMWKTKLEVFFQCFGHLKRLTLYMVELMGKWKQYIQSLTHDQKKQREQLSYYYQEDNYMLKMLTDLGFLRVSVLANFFDFSMRNDPFLMKCILTFQSKPNKTLDDELLKQLIFPDQQQYYQIMTKLDILAKQYYNNIQKRRVYDLARSPKKRSKNPANIYDPNESPNKRMVDRANRYLRDFTERKAKSQAKFNRMPVEGERGGGRGRSGVKEEEDPENPNSPKRKKLPFELKEGSKMSKSFRVIEFNKDRRKIDVLAASSLRDGNFPAASTLFGATKNTQNTEQSPEKTDKKWTLTPKPPVFQSKSPTKQQTPDMQMVDTQTLNKLKQQVVRRVKNDFKHNSLDVHTGQPQPRNQALAQIITQQLSTASKRYFPYQPIRKQTKQLQLITKTFKQDSVKSQLLKIFKHYPQPYVQLQMTSQSLQYQIQNNLYCIILQAVIASQTIGYMFCGLDTTNCEFKILKVYHVMVYNIGYLEEVMLKGVEFLWRYENGFELEFTFITPTANKELMTFTEELNAKLGKNCLVIVKQAYSHQLQSRLIFKRPLKNTSYIPNRYPGQFYLDLKLLLSRQPLIDSTGTRSTFIPQDTLYQYLLAEALRLYTTSDDIIMLKQRSPWRGKLKHVLDTVLKIQSSEVKVPGTTVTEEEKMVDVNKGLKVKKEKLIELGDSKKENRVCLLQTRIAMKFAQKMQYALIDSTPYYRITINSKIQLLKTPTITGYFINSDNRPQSLFFLPASQYLQSIQKSICLLIYLNRLLSTRINQVQELKHLWVPMHRVPKEFSERDEIYVKTNRLSELAILKKELYYSQEVEWFTDLSLQNGLEVQPQQYDVVIKKPYIMAVVVQNSPIYAKCVRQ